MYVVLCGADFNLKWMLRAIALLGLFEPVLLYAAVVKWIKITKRFTGPLGRDQHKIPLTVELGEFYKAD